MKILHYFPTTRLSEGGTVRAAIDFCTVLARRGHEVLWVTSDDTDVPQSWKDCDDACPTVHMLGPLGSGNRLTKNQLIKIETLVNASDVVHIHAMWDLSNPQVAKTCKKNKTPWVLSVHGMLDDWSMGQRKLKKVLYLATAGRILAKSTTVFHTTAEEEKRQASKWLKHNNISVIPCIVDLDPYKEVPNPALAYEKFGEVDAPTVLFLSRVHEKKSIETLIDATVILKKKGVPIRLFIAGTGEQSYIDSLIRRAVDAGVDDQVTLLGMVVGDLKLSLYAMADVFALPTQQENFGLVFAEAMLCETPIIGTKGTDIWRELEEGGAMIAERSPAAFAHAIETITSDPELARSLGKKGRERMLAWLNTDVVGEQCEKMYQNAINAR